MCSGSLYVDDGDSVDVGDAYTDMTFAASLAAQSGKLTSSVYHSSCVLHSLFIAPCIDIFVRRYDPSVHIETITFVGVPFGVRSVTVNGQTTSMFTYDHTKQVRQPSLPHRAAHIAVFDQVLTVATKLSLLREFTVSFAA